MEVLQASRYFATVRRALGFPCSQGMRQSLLSLQRFIGGFDSYQFLLSWRGWRLKNILRSIVRVKKKKTDMA